MRYTIPTLMALSQVTDVVCNWTSNARECNLVRPGLNKRPVLKETSANIAAVSSAEAQQSGKDSRSKAKSPCPPKMTSHSTSNPSFTPTEAGFARFLQEHSTSTHQRVTAGGLIVPMNHPARASQMHGELSIDDDMDSVGSDSQVTVLNIHNIANPAPTAHRVSASNAASLNPEAPTFMPGDQAPARAVATISPMQEQYQNRIMSLVQDAVQQSLQRAGRPPTMSGAHVNTMPSQNRAVSLAQHAGGPPTMSGAHVNPMPYQNMNLVQYASGPPTMSGAHVNLMPYQNGGMNLMQYAGGPPTMSGAHVNPIAYQNMNLVQYASGTPTMSGAYVNPMAYPNMNLMQHADGPPTTSGAHVNPMGYQNQAMNLVQHAGGPSIMSGAHINPGYRSAAVYDAPDTDEASTDGGGGIDPQQSQAGLVIISLSSLEGLEERRMLWPPDLPNVPGETTLSHMRMQIAAQNLVEPLPIPNVMQHLRLRGNPALRLPLWQPIPFVFPGADIPFWGALGPGGQYWTTLTEIFRLTNEGRNLTVIDYRLQLIHLVRIVAQPSDKYQAFMLLHAIDWLAYHEWLIDQLIASVHRHPDPLMGPSALPQFAQHYLDLRAEVQAVIKFLRQSVRRQRGRTVLCSQACDFWRELAFSALYGNILSETQDEDSSTDSEKVAPWDRDSWSDEIASDQDSDFDFAPDDGEGDAEGAAHADDGSGKGVQVVGGDQTSSLSAGRGTHISVLAPTGLTTARSRLNMAVDPVTPRAQISKSRWIPPAAVTHAVAYANKGKLSDVETILARLRR